MKLIEIWKKWNKLFEIWREDYSKFEKLNFNFVIKALELMGSEEMGGKEFPILKNKKKASMKPFIVNFIYLFFLDVLFDFLVILFDFFFICFIWFFLMLFLIFFELFFFLISLPFHIQSLFSYLLIFFKLIFSALNFFSITDFWWLGDNFSGFDHKPGWY